MTKPDLAVVRKAVIAAMHGEEYVQAIVDLRSSSAKVRETLYRDRIAQAKARGGHALERQVHYLIRRVAIGDTAALRVLVASLPELNLSDDWKWRAQTCIGAAKSTGGRPPHEHADQTIALGIAAAIQCGLSPTETAKTKPHSRKERSGIPSACSFVASLLKGCNLTGAALEKVWNRWKNEILWTDDDFAKVEARARYLFGDN